jgi:hypothetical protein
MSEAVKLIVDGYVSLKDRKALEALREHRQRLSKTLHDQSKLWFDTSRSVQLYEEDLKVIEAGLARL